MALGYAEGTERCRHNWDVGLKGVARLEGKGLQLGRLQRPCSETGCHCLKALGVPRAGPLENPSGHDMASPLERKHESPAHNQRSPVSTS